MIKIGILGEIGSGKSYVARNFGYPVFNADYEVAKLYQKNKKVFYKLKTQLPKYINSFPIDKVEISNAILANVTNLSQLSLLETVDTWSYRIIGLGFPFLTIGIISGAVWANEAWGSYWSWDPKETWALITWLVFAVYLHSRLLKGWQGTKAATIGSFGFFVIWICYLGVNFLGKGLHSYGWVLS